MVYLGNHTKHQYACVGNMFFFYNIKAVRTYSSLYAVAVHLSSWFSRVTINAEFKTQNCFFLSCNSSLTEIRKEGKTLLWHVPKLRFSAVTGSTFPLAVLILRILNLIHHVTYFAPCSLLKI